MLDNVANRSEIVWTKEYRCTEVLYYCYHRIALIIITALADWA